MPVFTAEQREMIMATVAKLPPEKRGLFVERLEARLQLCGSRITATDIEDAVRVALRGLTHHSAA